MDTSLSIEQKYSLVTRRLEIQNGWSAQKLLSLLHGHRALKYLWVTAPTGKPHIGYFVPLIKFADFIRTGGEVTIDLADLYAFLINCRFPWDQVRHRTGYYRQLLTATLEAIGVPMSKVSLIDMSLHQNTPESMADFWKLCVLCSQQDVRETGEEVSASTMLSPLLCPLMQELSEEHLGIDVQLGGKDQRGIFNLGEQFLPGLGYEKRAHLLNELIPSLAGGKMSSSSLAHTKIMFLDGATEVEEKITAASCPARAVEGNGILPIIQHILMPIREIKMLHQNHRVNGTSATKGIHEGGILFSVAVSEDSSHRGYRTYEELQRDYVTGSVDPLHLKEAVASALNEVLEPIRKAYQGSEEWRRDDQMGYPEDWPS